MEIVGRIRDRHGVTDYGAAKLLGITYSGMQRYRQGGGMDDKVAIRAAALLGEDPQALVFALHAERAADPESRAFWESAKQSVAATALVLVAVALWCAGTGDSMAWQDFRPIAVPGHSLGKSVYYVKSAACLFRAWLQGVARISRVRILRRA